MDEMIRELLYRSFDDDLSPEEKHRLDEALEKSAELRTEQEKLSRMRKEISGSAEKSFEPLFVDRLMNRIQVENQKKSYSIDDFLDSLAWSFKRIALAASIAVIILLAVNIFQEKNISLDSLLAMPQITVQETWELNDLTEGEL
jgi:hypothetical protein